MALASAAHLAFGRKLRRASAIRELGRANRNSSKTAAQKFNMRLLRRRELQYYCVISRDFRLGALLGKAALLRRLTENLCARSVVIRIGSVYWRLVRLTIWNSGL